MAEEKKFPTEAMLKAREEWVSRLPPQACPSLTKNILKPPFLKLAAVFSLTLIALFDIIKLKDTL